jgi:hypothetical protein
MTGYDRNIVIVNQASNYLTVGLANAFSHRFKNVVLITGSIHEQGEVLSKNVRICWIDRWLEAHTIKKQLSYIKACMSIYFLLLFKFRNYEVIFLSVPPMAYLINIIIPNKSSMILWDIFPDNLRILGINEKHPIYRIWMFLNKLSFRKAYRLFTIGDSMAELLAQYVDRDRITVQPLWSIFNNNGKLNKEKNPFIREHKLQGKFVVQYSGNIGLTHNVEAIVNLAICLRDWKDIIFLIIGRGPRKDRIQKMVNDLSLDNCQFLPFQSDDDFPYSLSACDLGVVVLDERTGKASVPSKSYNLMSYAIPSLYIGPKDSELQRYADKYGHARCFSIGDLKSAAEFILNLSRDKLLYDEMSRCAEIAAMDFKPGNADRIVEKYEEILSTYK